MRAVKIYFVDGKNVSDKCVRLGFDTGREVDYFHVPKSQVLEKGCSITKDGSKYNKYIVVPMWLARNNGWLNKDGWGMPIYTMNIIDWDKGE